MCGRGRTASWGRLAQETPQRGPRGTPARVAGAGRGDCQAPGRHGAEEVGPVKPGITKFYYGLSVVFLESCTRRRGMTFSAGARPAPGAASKRLWISATASLARRCTARARHTCGATVSRSWYAVTAERRGGFLPCRSGRAEALVWRPPQVGVEVGFSCRDAVEQRMQSLVS